MFGFSTRGVALCGQWGVKPRTGRLAQLVERLLYTQDVGGSIPSPPTSLRRFGSAQPATIQSMKKKRTIVKRHPDGSLWKLRSDGSEKRVVPKPLRPMTDAEITAAARSDPDAQPLTPERMAKMKRVPRVKILRRSLGLTQEEFAARFRIPLGTLRDWEQGRSEPDQPGKNLLTLIANDPKGVAKTLESAR